MRVLNLADLQELFFGTYPLFPRTPKMNGKDMVETFFPDNLYEKYEDKTIANFSCFMNPHPKNKAMRQYLRRMFLSQADDVLAQMERKADAFLQNAQSGGTDLTGATASLRDAVSASSFCKAVAPRPELFISDPPRFFARVLLSVALWPDEGGVLPAAAKDDLLRVWFLPDGDDFLSPSTPEDAYRRAMVLKAEGNSRQALALFTTGVKRSLATRRGADDVENLFDLCERLHARNEEEAELFLEAGKLMVRSANPVNVRHGALCIRYAYIPACPRAAWELSKLYRDGISVKTNPHRAGNLLKEAANNGVAPAMLALANALFAGDERLQIERAEQEAAAWYEKASLSGDLSATEQARCVYMRAVILEQNGQTEEAYQLYESVSTRSPEAARALRRMQGITPSMAELLNAPGATGYIVLADDSARQNILESLHVAQPVFAPTDLPALRDLLSREAASLGDRPSFLLMSDDTRKNLAFALAVLAYTFPENTQAIISLFCSTEDAEFLNASPLLRSSPTVLVRLIDPARESVFQLLRRRPLFLPLLKDNVSSIRPVIVGSSRSAELMIREMYAAGCMRDIDFALSCFTDDPASMEARLYDQAPGLFIHAGSNILRAPAPAFYTCDLTHGGISALIRDESEKASDPGAIFLRGNYFVFATADSHLNLLLAKRVRELFAAESLYPFIAAYTPDPSWRWLGRGLFGTAPISPDAYNIFCFGALESLTDRLLTDPLDRLAFSIHQAYSQDNLPTAYETFQADLQNRTSSRQLALYLPYRVFAAARADERIRRLTDADLSAETLWTDPAEWPALGEIYTKLLDSESALNQEARAEHARWCAALLADGWLPADLRDVENYTREGVTDHRYLLAKLHPFLTTWENIDARRGMPPALVRIMRSSYPDQNYDHLVNPQASDILMVRNTAKWLGEQT